MGWFRDGTVPFSAMVMVECTNVGLKILFKAATFEGLSYDIFIVYSYAIATLVLLPFAAFFSRRTELPPSKIPIFCKICLLGLIGFLAQMCGYKGIEYSSPMLASAVSNLTPAFTFILAILFRLEKIGLRSSSSQAKVAGTLVSISGAFIVVLYKGPAILTIRSQLKVHHTLSLLASDWFVGGFLLVAEYFLLSVCYIVQAQILLVYPAELAVVFFYNLCATIISAPVCLIADWNLNDWKVTSAIALIAILYSGLFGSSLGTVIHSWGLRLKGPVYIALFKPLSIVIAAVMGFIFLGENLYLGSVVGGVVISFGFYVVMWGKASEEMGEDLGANSLESPSIEKAPLLEGYLSEARAASSSSVQILSFL